jgi:hypothetical protein
VKVCFEWLDFDGDDCFSDFHIDMISGTQSRRFEFGACAVNNLRKVSRFFRDQSLDTVGGGFRNPDVRYYDVFREKDGYRLSVHYEQTGLHEELRIPNPRTELDDEFMKSFYSS